MGIEALKSKIEAYRKKFYLNSIIKGSLQFVIVMGLTILIISLLEHYFWFDRNARTIVFYLSIVLLASLLVIWVIMPIAKYLKWIESDFTEFQLARIIGDNFPSVKDKLLNALQLNAISEHDSSLIHAGIDSYLKNLKPIPFTNSIDYRVNFKYVRYLFFIMLSMGCFSLFYPGLYSNSAKRVVNYTKEYSRPLPFEFLFEDKNLHVFRNEPFEIRLSVEGESIPERVYLILDDRKISMIKNADASFEYTISTTKNQLSFSFEGSGFNSRIYNIPVHNRAELTHLDIDLDYPDYTGISDETIESGRLYIPEGTIATWNIQTKAVDKASIIINDSTEIHMQLSGNQSFISSHPFLNDAFYEIKLANEFATNKESIKYQVSLIPDEYPEIEATFYLDTILYEYLIVSGETTDDYGIQSIRLLGSKNEERILNEFIASPNNQNSFSYYHQVDLQSYWEKIDESNLTLYVQATDNDAINGNKSTRSQSFVVKLPTKSSIEQTIADKTENTSKDLQKSIQNASSINDKIKQLQERILSKQQLEWQEDKLLKELIEQRKRIEEQVQQLQDQFNDLNNAEEKFNDRSEALQEKAKKLQQLMDEVLDEETKKMYEELQQLMEENADLDQLGDKLDQLSGNEENLEQELERALELFKRLKVESELEKSSKALEKLGERQEILSKETQSHAEKESSGDDQPDTPGNELMEKQEEINQDFSKIEEQLDKIEQLNQELKNPEPLGDLSEDMEEIQQGLDKAKEQLENQDFKSGSEQQKQNTQKLKQLGQKMAQMMQSMQMEMITEDVNNLRNILDNLVKLSYQQESLIDEFYKVTQVDPKFVALSQEQLKLKDDAKVLEDSLLALSERVVEMSSFITREIGLVNDNIDAAVENLRNRDRNKALSNQQFSMASINNLALLLDDLLQQMQNAMASSMGQGKPQDSKGQGLPDLKQLQQQLSQDIQQLKDSGKKGRQLSEKLAKMAAQQEMLREKLSELQNSLKGQPGGEEAGDAMEKALLLMEQNEIDLVNKRLTQDLMNRQEDIMTRMLDAENAMKEQEYDNERKGQTANEIERTLPKAFQEYLLERKKQIELQKSVPIGLIPFYKKEVNDYFRRLSENN
jgi:hypothetical protein